MIVHLLSSLQGLVGGRPLLFGLTLFAALLIARRAIGARAFASTRAATWTIAVCAYAALGALPIIAIWYASDPHFFDNAEPTMVAIGWLFHVGQPVYHAVDAAERYAHIYGPLAFMSHGFALGIFGANILVSKAVGAAAAMISLACILAALRHHVSWSRAIVWTGVSALLLLAFRNTAFWTRPDPLQLAAASAALLCAVRGRRSWSWALVGVASGVLWNMKFTGPLYSVPVFVLLQRRSGWRGAAMAATVAFAVAAVPFVAFANISWTNYIAWVGLSAKTGLLLATLRQNLEWAMFLCVPVLIASRATGAESVAVDNSWGPTVAGLLAGMSGIVIAAAKPGAGPYHLMPFIPIVIYLAAWRVGERPLSAIADPAVPPAVMAFSLATVVIATAEQSQLISTMVERGRLHEIADIDRFAGTHAGVVAMGYGGTEALSFERPVLVFKSGTYLLDQPAIREHQLAGLETPPATVDAIAGCRVAYWLIPKNEVPFSGRNAYAAVFLRPMYSDAFRAAFQSAYRRVDATESFDVWACEAKAGS